MVVAENPVLVFLVEKGPEPLLGPEAGPSGPGQRPPLSGRRRRAMGNRRRFKEFLRHQEATAAYKRALATASDNVQKFGSPAAHRPRPHTAMVRTHEAV